MGNFYLFYSGIYFKHIICIVQGKFFIYAQEIKDIFVVHIFKCSSGLRCFTRCNSQHRPKLIKCEQKIAERSQEPL